MKYEGLDLWKQVQMTDPSHTKDASFGRKITTIDAYHQIKNFTEKFGPCGIGWGYKSDIVEAPHTACVVRLELWIKDEGSLTEFGTCDWYQRSKRNPEGTFDLEAPKKATTDALTKAFSRLGFNADIFMGMFEDNRYVQHAAQEKNVEKSEKAREEFDDKNCKMINKRLKDVKDAASLHDVMQKMELHFAPLYTLEVGKFFDIPLFRGLIENRAKELNLDPKEFVNG